MPHCAADVECHQEGLSTLLKCPEWLEQWLARSNGRRCCLPERARNPPAPHARALGQACRLTGCPRNLSGFLCSWATRACSASAWL